MPIRRTPTLMEPATPARERSGASAGASWLSWFLQGSSLRHYWASILWSGDGDRDCLPTVHRTCPQPALRSSETRFLARRRLLHEVLSDSLYTGTLHAARDERAGDGGAAEAR